MVEPILEKIGVNSDGGTIGSMDFDHMLAQADNSNNSSNSDRSEKVNAILDTGKTGTFLTDQD